MNKSYAENISIEGRLIGLGHPTYFVADIAANHDGSLSRAKELIHMAAEAGADAAKFQHFDAATIVSDKGFKALGNQLSQKKIKNIELKEAMPYDDDEKAVEEIGFIPLSAKK